jgi:parallel beta-helix repeat protein
LPIEEVPFTTVIRNGTICNWGGDGIRIDDISVTGEEPVVTGKILVHSNSELLNLSIHGNTEMGFRGGNCCAHMEQVSFCNNAGNGIEVHEAYLHMEEVSVYNNTGHGLVADDNSCCRMEDVAFSYNGGHGMHILGMMTNVDAYGTCSTHNLGNGMYVDVTGDGYVHMEEVSFSHNHGNGVQILGMMTNVDAYSGWASNNNGGGIIVNGSANLTKCSSIANGQVGIQVGDGSTVKKCTARRNSGDGILVSTNCVVSGNACQGTGTGDLADTAGIRATGSGNRIEANHITDNDRGIDVDASGNLIIRNSASGNTADYDIAAGNTSGPTVDDTDITTSSNPHANYAI